MTPAALTRLQYGNSLWTSTHTEDKSRTSVLPCNKKLRFDRLLSILNRDDLLPVPLVDVRPVVVIKKIVFSNGEHVRIDALTSARHVLASPIPSVYGARLGPRSSLRYVKSGVAIETEPDDLPEAAELE